MLKIGNIINKWLSGKGKISLLIPFSIVFEKTIFSSLFMGQTISYYCIKSSSQKKILKKTNYKNKSQKQKEQLKNYYLFRTNETPLINI